MAQGRAHPVVAGSRRVALVEDEIDDLEDGGQPGGPRLAVRRLERNAGAGQRLLGADDALGDGRLRHQVGAGDLGRGQAAEQAQRQRDPGLHGQHRVAGREDQPQQVVVDVIGDGPVEVRRCRPRPRPRGPGRSRRTCVPGRGCGGTGRRPGVSRRSSARRPGSAARRRAGHCSRAATTASWASSSARPMSPPAYLASPAMRRADSSRMTVSIAAWARVACEPVTRTDPTTGARIGQARPAPPARAARPARPARARPARPPGPPRRPPHPARPAPPHPPA